MFSITGLCALPVDPALTYHSFVAIATDVGAMILVTLNGMTLLPYRKKNVELDELGKAPEGV